MHLPIRKIVFIEPKAPGVHVFSGMRFPRLGALQLGTILKAAGYEVKVFVEFIQGIDFDAVFDADAVGISTITFTAPRAYAMARQIRKAGVPVFLGGSHVSFMVEEALESCDYVIRGEAEESIIPFVQALESGQGFEKVPGLAWKSEKGIRVNPLPPPVMDLDRYPFPDFDLVSGTKKIKGNPPTPILTSRGCPFGCNFCTVTRMFGRRYRFRSTESVIQELKMRNPKWVFFCDNNFAANPSHTKELLGRMIEEGATPKRGWAAEVRIDVAKDLKLLELMKQSGCYRLLLGVESINPKTLTALKKGQTPEEIEKAIRIIQSYGIRVHGMFMFGGDHDDVDTVYETLKFAKKMQLASVQFVTLLPYPGTELFQQMEAEGRLLSRDWGYYDGYHVVFQPKGMSFLQLQKMTQWAMVKFYSIRQILNSFIRFDIVTMIVRAYGWRISRRGRRSLKGFNKQLKELYKQSGQSIGRVHHSLELRAHSTADDIKDYFRSINLDRIRKMREERIRHKQP